MSTPLVGRLVCITGFNSTGGWFVSLGCSEMSEIGRVTYSGSFFGLLLSVYTKIIKTDLEFSIYWNGIRSKLKFFGVTRIYIFARQSLASREITYFPTSLSLFTMTFRPPDCAMTGTTTMFRNRSMKHAIDPWLKQHNLLF